MSFSRILTELNDDDGQGLAEYGLILVLIAVIAVAALTAIGTDVSSLLDQAANSV